MSPVLQPLMMRVGYRSFCLPVNVANDKLAIGCRSSHNSHMQAKSLAHAKAHLSALVDQAEHHQKRILILRHGKPAAAIVPVEVAVPVRRSLSTAEIDNVFAALGDVAPQVSAVDDLLAGRR
jgi:prevent-host-death family protein